jgi:Zn-dependent peptidase ImmA (M78 family)
VRSKNITADKSVLGLIAFEDAKVPCYDLAYRPIELDLSAGDILIDMSLSGNRNIPRRRFTLAHEASHWILHRSYHSPTNQKYEFRKPYIKTLGKNIERKFTGFKTESDEEEWQANSLAAALLMPKMPFMEYALNEVQRVCGGGNDYFIENQSEDYIMAIENIAGVFNVSRLATEIRLEQLGLLKLA